MEDKERDYNEVYDNGNGLLEVFVHVGARKVFSATNRKTRARKVFRTLPDLEAFLYNRGYHIIMSDRRQMFMRNMDLYWKRNMIRLTTRPDGSAREVCFRHGWRICTGWVLDYNPCDKNQVIVRCNCQGAYTNVTGYKTVTVPIESIAILSDY